MRRAVFLLAALGAARPAQPGDATPPQPATPLRYPIGSLPLPDFLAPGDPLTLSDLRFTWPDSSADASLLARVRFRSLGYVTAEVEGERHGLSFLGHRLSLSAFEADDDWTLAAAWRAPRFVLSGDARSSQGRGGRSWAWGPTLQFLVAPNVEVYAFLEADTGRPRGRSVTELGAGSVWQLGTRLEAGLQYARDYRITAAGDENRVDTAQATLVVQAQRAEVSAFGLFEDTRGRFPRREGETSLRLRVSLLPRLLLDADASGRFDERAGALRHAYAGSLTWFGRRFTLPRAGATARRSLELARAATAAGEYELTAFGDDALRAQRERLSLSGRAPELRDAIEAAYRAQLDERDVPLVGVGLRYEDDVFTGASTHSLSALVGMPWPAAWPWSSSDGFVRFLTLELEHDWTTTASHFRSEADRVTLTVSLSREMDVVAGYLRREPSAQDVVLGVGVRSRFSLACVYARGR